jgi:nicotinamidase-related amidase
MKSAVFVIDVQQGLCEGEGTAFDCEATITRIYAVTSAQQVIAHQNVTLTNITSFGPRVQAVPSADIGFA